jgi:hypothetical protein
MGVYRGMAGPTLCTWDCAVSGSPCEGCDPGSATVLVEALVETATVAGVCQPTTGCFELHSLQLLLALS